ncbi:MAG: NosD domain-containing protein [Candidatus Heimdallarchaeaceae archaeon]
MHKLKIILIALLPFLTILMLLALSIELPLISGVNIKTAYDVYNPIIITSDSDFSVFNGSGTVADPYRIENLEISATGTNNAIYISGTTKYFEIANCSLTGENVVIVIDNIAEGTAKLINNTVWLPNAYSNHDLVKIQLSKNLTIVNNTFDSGDKGINMQYCSNTLIENNTFIGQQRTSGVLGTGVLVYKSDNTTIKNNYFEGVVGVNNDQTSNLAVLNNTFVSCGIIISSGTTLEALENLELVDNTVNNLEIGLFKNIANSTFESTDYGQLILINCSDIVIVNQNVADVSNAIAVYYSTNVVVKESHFEHVVYALLSASSEQISFNNNLISEGNVYYKQCNDVAITNNLFNISKISNAFIYFMTVNNALIANNSITSDNNRGIDINDANNIVIANNSILEYVDSGVHLSIDVTNVEIYGNLFMTLNFHYGIGIDAYHTSGATIKIYNNTFIENKIGIYSYLCSNLVIHHNYFINSTENNAIDDGSSGNIWYDTVTMEGNYWSDKNKTGFYYIPGTSGAYDPYPMLPEDNDGDSISDLLEYYVYGTNPKDNDTDGDKLSDHLEIFDTNTDPLIKDTDSDGLNDYEEVYTYPTDPLDNDTDNDGLSDGEEILTYHSDPLVEDTDNDGINDFDETKIWQTSPLSNDTDGDGVSDYYEIYVSSTDPISNDTDNDGLNDYDELYVYYTNGSNSDTDNDGLTDGQEVFTYSTDPRNADTDHDGLKDGEEIKTYNTNPLKADSDNDGYSDYEEIQAGTDPNDLNSYPNMTKTTSIPSDTKTIDINFLNLIAIITLLGILTYAYKKQLKK